MKKVLVSVALMLIATGLVSGTPLCTAGTTVVGAGAVTACQVGPLTFGNFSAIGFAGSVLINGINSAGGGVSLLFQISPGLGQNAGFTFKYSVTGGPQIGFDVEHDSGVIIEDVCSVPFGGTFGTTCDGTKLGHYYSGGGISGLILFNNNAQVNTAYFVKDISTGAGEGLSHFVNSHHYVPEPATYGMLGAGLLALSLLRRRK